MAKPQIKEVTTNAPKFAIEESVPVPSRTKDVPDYGLEDVFSNMKPGQSVLVKFSEVPKQHAQMWVARCARGSQGKRGTVKRDPIDLVTRTVKSDDGKTEIGLRVWRNS